MANPTIQFQRRRQGVPELLAGPALSALLLSQAGKAAERAKTLAPQRSGVYRDSFGHSVVHTGKAGRPVGRAFNSAPYAATIELGGRKTRKGGRLRAGGPKHRCLGRGLESLQGTL